MIGSLCCSECGLWIFCRNWLIWKLAMKDSLCRCLCYFLLSFGFVELVSAIILLKANMDIQAAHFFPIFRAFGDGFIWQCGFDLVQPNSCMPIAQILMDERTKTTQSSQITPSNCAIDWCSSWSVCWRSIAWTANCSGEKVKSSPILWKIESWGLSPIETSASSGVDPHVYSSKWCKMSDFRWFLWRDGLICVKG